MAKEIVLAVLAIASVAIGVFEVFSRPSPDVLKLIDAADVAIALIFLADFLWMFSVAKSRKLFFRRNWYLLLACIPLYSSWAAVLRGIRILGVFRLLRAAEHLNYSLNGQK